MQSIGRKEIIVGIAIAILVAAFFAAPTDLLQEIFTGVGRLK